MSWTTKEILSVVELVIYVTVAPALIYTIFKHRTPSTIGHIYLFVFISLRVVADGLAISHRNNSTSTDTTGAIINSIGLSPLLLATAGIIYEARHYIFDYVSNEGVKKIGCITELVLHVLVVAGVALLAVGGSKSATATTTSDLHRYRALSNAGSILLLTSWVLICVWGFWSLKASSRQKKTGQYNKLARLLLVEILVSLLFTGIRVCYSVVYTLHHSPALNPATSTFAVAFILVFLVQLISAATMMIALFVTRNIRASNGSHVLVSQRDGSDVQLGGIIK